MILRLVREQDPRAGSSSADCVPQSELNLEWDGHYPTVEPSVVLVSSEGLFEFILSVPEKIHPMVLSECGILVALLYWSFKCLFMLPLLIQVQTCPCRR